jgi:hypothetical protein
MNLFVLGRLCFLAVLDRWEQATADPERGDGGPIPTAVIVAAVLAAALLVVGLIAAAVAKYSKGIK